MMTAVRRLCVAMARAFLMGGLLSLSLPCLAAEWSFQVVADEDLSAVDNIVLGDDGALYATLELGGGRGKLVRIEGGVVTPLLGGLDRPDGLLLQDDRLVLTEEAVSGRVLEYSLRTGTTRLLARLSRPEGIDRLGNGDLVVAEDKAGGRLVRITPLGQIQVLVSALNRPEGLCVDKSGVIYVAVTGDGNIIAVNPALSYRQHVVRSGLRQPDQVECHVDGSLWISEDANPGRLLRLDPVSGRLETILSGLHAPQGIAFARDGSVYVAEQGRGRILQARSPVTGNRP